MKIHGLCVVKNEQDIIAQTLRAAAQWCDNIYVLDNGSDDGTWEIVQALSKDIDAVRPFRRDPKPFFDNIRDDILSAHTARAASDDWWCILDADEFYIDDPRSFLRDVPRQARSVWRQTYSYLFTDKDLVRYRQDPDLFGDAVPIEEKLRYYVVGEYSELRFFRHSPGMRRVPVRGYDPIHPQRIRLRHYAYRSPEQIATRLRTRRDSMKRGDFVHEKKANWLPGGEATHGPALPDELPESWEERVVPHAGCHFDGLDGLYAEAPTWTPPGAAGGALETSFADGMAGWSLDALKRMGRLFLPGRVKRRQST